MPFLNIDGLRVYYRLDGGDHQPALILSHSLGQDHGMWDPQIPDLARHFRVLRYDLRGHGASDSPPQDATIERLGRDVLGMADALGIERFSLCGLSIGGMIGQWIAGAAQHNSQRILFEQVVASRGQSARDHPAAQRRAFAARRIASVPW